MLMAAFKDTPLASARSCGAYLVLMLTLGIRSIRRLKSFLKAFNLKKEQVLSFMPVLFGEKLLSKRDSRVRDYVSACKLGPHEIINILISVLKA